MEKEDSKIDAKDVNEQPGEDIHYHHHMDESVPPKNKKSPEVVYDEKQRAVHYHYYYEPPKIRKEKSSKPTIAGALLLITAVLGLLSGAVLLGAGFFVGDLGEGISFFGENENGDIIGTVTYFNGTPAADVNISIVDEPLTTKTDSEGNYVIHNVPTGNQKIQVEKEGYNTIIYKAFIGPSNIHEDRDHDFENNFDFTLTEGDQILERGNYPPWEWIKSAMLVCGGLIIIFSIIALIGAFYAFKRKGFGIALTGAILGLFTIIGTLFALIAIFILLISRDEFKKTTEDIPPRISDGG